MIYTNNIYLQYVGTEDLTFKLYEIPYADKHGLWVLLHHVVYE